MHRCSKIRSYLSGGEALTRSHIQLARRDGAVVQQQIQVPPAPLRLAITDNLLLLFSPGGQAAVVDVKHEGGPIAENLPVVLAPSASSDQASSDQVAPSASSDQASSDQASSDQVAPSASSDQASSDQVAPSASSDQASSDQVGLHAAVCRHGCCRGGVGRVYG